MQQICAGCDHFFSCFLGSPSLVSHSVCRDGHACAVVAQAAVDVDFLIRIVANDLEKLCEYFVAREHAEPWDRNELHAGRSDPFAVIAYG